LVLLVHLEAVQLNTACCFILLHHPTIKHTKLGLAVCGQNTLGGMACKAAAISLS
jgi:hypothetical protein